VQATFKLSDLLALGAALLACGGLLVQVQGHDGRIATLESESKTTATRLATMDTNIQFLVNAERERRQEK
jgi:hypothetical protein